MGGAAAASAGARGPAAARVFRTKEKRVTTQKNPDFFAANTGTSPWKGIIQGKNDLIPEPEAEFSDDLFPEGTLETLQDVAITLMRVGTAAMMIHHGQEKLLSAEMFTNFVMTKYFAFLPGGHHPRGHVLPPGLHGHRGLPPLHHGREGPGVPQLRLRGALHVRGHLPLLRHHGARQ